MGGHRNCDHKLPSESWPTHQLATAVLPPTLPHSLPWQHYRVGVVTITSPRRPAATSLPATLLNPVATRSPRPVQLTSSPNATLLGGWGKGRCRRFSQPRVFALSQREALGAEGQRRASAKGTASESPCPGQEGPQSPPPSPGQARMETLELPRTCFWSQIS